MQYYVYILFSKPNGTLYVGVTSDLIQRISQHKTKYFSGFTAKYNVNKLGYFEVYENIEEAIKREKALKGSSRQRKLNLILSMNPKWKDLYEEIIK